MKTVILAGGLGTRLRDVSMDVPKPMVPIGGVPIIYHLMKYYASWGHKEFILCLGYKSVEIKNYFLNLNYYTQDITIKMGSSPSVCLHSEENVCDWDVTLAETGIHSLTATRINKIRKYLKKDESFMLTYADGLSDVNLDELCAFHESHDKIMTVTGVFSPGRFGEMIFDSKGLVSEFSEKPQQSNHRISGGFFICRKEVFDYFPSEDVMFEQEPMSQMAKDNQIMVYPHNGFWHSMDTPRDYEYFNKIYNKGYVPWKKV